MTNEKKVMQNTVVKSTPPKRKRRAVSLDKNKARSGWLFVLPFIIGFVIIYLPIVLESIWLTFNKITYVGAAYELDFSGLANYNDALFKDAGYVPTLISGLKDLAFDIPAIVIFSLFMAVLLNQKMFGRGVFRAIFFIPVILSTGVMDAVSELGASLDIESIDTGAVGEDVSNQIINAADLDWLFGNMKVGTELKDYVAAMVSDIYGIVDRSGVQMLIFLSGLQSISPAIYESCSIDGATAWETFWKVTLPMISPMILVNAVYTIIDAFTAGDNLVMMYISNSTSLPPIKTAMSWVYFLIVILILAAVAGIFSGFVFYQKKD